jgi:hypothetical protein
MVDLSVLARSWHETDLLDLSDDFRSPGKPEVGWPESKRRE